MRIGHLELVSGKGKVEKTASIYKSDNQSSDERERQRQKRLVRWLWLDRMNEEGAVLKLYDSYGRLVEIVDTGRSIGRSISVRA